VVTAPDDGFRALADSRRDQEDSQVTDHSNPVVLALLSVLDAQAKKKGRKSVVKGVLRHLRDAGAGEPVLAGVAALIAKPKAEPAAEPKVKAKAARKAKAAAEPKAVKVKVAKVKTVKAKVAKTKGGKAKADKAKVAAEPTTLHA
jgi:hypothetical protein